ncbi:ROK family protein [Saccharopolyspora rosea]|uniref:ROK family protein n=1 Tax=Saccharopolyspora rosea TaxID=524884 RepID=UPI0021DAEC7C|nr:ROK family protein [Saccharopolyspora rosea]
MDIICPPGPESEGGREIAGTTSGDARRAGSVASRAAIIAALRRHGPMTRRRLVAETGLSRATVSGALAALAADGRIRETPNAAGGTRGRPSMLVGINESRADLVGIEIGRAHLAVAVADGADTVIATADRDIPARTSILARTEAALALLAEVAAEQGLDLSTVRGVAAGTPGPKFTGKGRSADLALARFTRDRAEVAAQLTARFGVPVRVENNTRYTALAETAAADDRDVAYLRVDEGVGGGVVVDGSLVSGSWGTAGELGHVCVDPTGPRCACGGRGCVELVASLPALLAATGSADLAALDHRLRAHDPDAAAALRKAAGAAAQALAGVLAVLDVSVVVVGGRVARLPGFLDLLEQLVRDVAPSWCAAELTVRPAHDDHTAGARGALVHARLAADAASNGDRARSMG